MGEFGSGLKRQIRPGTAEDCRADHESCLVPPLEGFPSFETQALDATWTMGATLDVVQQAYAAFGRRDIPALLKLVADEVDWKEVCPASWPNSGLR